MPIVASIITLIAFSSGGLDRRHVDAATSKPTVKRLHCNLGEAIPRTPKAVQLGVAGRKCTHAIIRLATPK
jgi:hypothetical protein